MDTQPMSLTGDPFLDSLFDGAPDAVKDALKGLFGTETPEEIHAANQASAQRFKDMLAAIGGQFETSVQEVNSLEKPPMASVALGDYLAKIGTTLALAEQTVQMTAHAATHAVDLIIESDAQSAAACHALQKRLNTMERIVGMLCTRTGVVDDCITEMEAKGDDRLAQEARQKLDTLRHDDSAQARLATGRTPSSAADSPHDGAH